MALIKWGRRSEWDPFKSLVDLQDDMNRLFDISLARMPKVFNEYLAFPTIDIKDKKDQLEIAVDLPGMKKEDISLEIHDNILTISGERKEEKEQKDANYYQKECFYGEFRRSVALPPDADPSKVDATYENGVLKITVSKKEQAKPKQIDIKIK